MGQGDVHNISQGRMYFSPRRQAQGRLFDKLTLKASQIRVRNDNRNMSLQSEREILYTDREKCGHGPCLPNCKKKC